MKIVVPDLLLPSWNEFYAGMHWSKRKGLADTIRMQVLAATPIEAETFSGPVNICVTAYRPRALDSDNVAAKLVIDGLCDAGLLQDDSPRWLHDVTTRGRRGQPRVEIKIVESSGTSR